MKHQIATNPSQSKRLLACGVDPNTADMCYVGGWSPECAIPFSKCNKEDTPAWSLSALLALLPRTITHKGRTNIFGLYHEEEKDGGQWNCSCHGTVFFLEDTPFEAIIKMIEWLTANGYPLNTK